jgi:hypothetical protein
MRTSAITIFAVPFLLFGTIPATGQTFTPVEVGDSTQVRVTGVDRQNGWDKEDIYTYVDLGEKCRNMGSKMRKKINMGTEFYMCPTKLAE